MSGAVAAGLVLAGLVLGCLALCWAAVWWCARTPRSGYLVLAVFGLYVLARYLP